MDGEGKEQPKMVVANSADGLDVAGCRCETDVESVVGGCIGCDGGPQVLTPCWHSEGFYV